MVTPAMRSLDRKLLRDLWQMKGQSLAISLVIACGVATFVMSLCTLESLKLSRATYYDRYRFADVFASLTRAPTTLEEEIRRIPGVARVQTRIVEEVTLDIAGLNEPAVGRLISVPDHGQPVLNDVYLREGRPIQPGRGEVLASEAFAEAHGFERGDTIRAVLNGRLKELKIVGIALSPEYVFQIKAGDAVPDNKRFGVFWMNETEMEAAFDMEGAFNNATLKLMPRASEDAVIFRLDRLTRPYGGTGAYGRDQQLSARYLADEIRGLRATGLVAPAIFLGVAAFLLNVVLSRIIGMQRRQIGLLKAFGYGHREIGRHFLKLVLLITLVGIVLGTALGLRLGQGMLGMYAEFYRFPVFRFQMDPAVLAMGVGISLLAALGGTFGSVLRAAGLPPAEAMRPAPPAQFRPTILERIGLQRFLSQPARMVLRQLERRPLKALLSTFGIALAVAVLILGRFVVDALDHLIEYQYYVRQRHDVSVTFVEPTSAAAACELRRLPGVLQSETFRSVPVKLRFRHREHRTGIMGLPQDPQLNRLVDPDNGLVELPPKGLLLSSKLADLLHVEPGNVVTAEVLEGERPVREVPVAAEIKEYAGTSAYMRADALHALLQEGGTLSGAFLSVDGNRRDELYALLKETPHVAGVTVKEAAVRSFRETVGETQLAMQRFNVIFACIIAFGVVYNTARVSLSERSRELATLRVIGFTRGEVSAILLGELAVLTLAAIPLGIAIGYGFAWLMVWAFESELFRIPLVISRWTLGFAAAVTLIASLISGLVVRERIEHLDLVGVLKERE